MFTYKRKLEGEKTAETMISIAPFEFVNIKSAVSIGFISKGAADSLEKRKEPENEN